MHLAYRLTRATRTPSPVRLLYPPLSLDGALMALRTDWQIWTAGTVTSTTVRDQFVRAVFSYASDGKNNQPLGDLYDTISGAQVANSGHARPVVGGHLALVRRNPPSSKHRANIFGSSRWPMLLLALLQDLVGAQGKPAPAAPTRPSRILICRLGQLVAICCVFRSARWLEASSWAPLCEPYADVE